ncbi:MAG: electron transfer flavoprotein subunit beta/FixA family protein [Clostridia bacterium]|nr:electron transfer flavoprotein subunit beta/FixA family protein [Clostridia bacterium]
MKFAVCVKQVPGTTEVQLDPVTHTIIRDGRKGVTNPFDAAAVELAVTLKEQVGGSVTAISMGIPAAESMLRDCIARGADEGVLLTDRQFAGADTLATSYTLSKGIEKMGGADCILCGRMAVDGDTAQIGPELAERLGLPHVTDVIAVLSVEENALVLRKTTADGTIDLRVALPCVITVLREVAQVRLPSIEGIRRSFAAPVHVWSAADIGTDPARTGLNGSPTQVMRTFVPEKTKITKMFSGTPEEQATALCTALKEVL